MNDKILISINKVLRTTSNDGGYISATCLCCDANGWLNTKYGFKYRKKEPIGLMHKKHCDMNKYASSKLKYDE